MNNANFKGVEFDTFKNQAGTNAFIMSPKRWIDKTNAIGLILYLHQKVKTDKNVKAGVKLIVWLGEYCT